MSRVEAASGAKYSAQKDSPRRFEPIAPVGTSYKPVGKVDIAALRAEAAQSAPKPVVPSAPRPTFGSSSASGFGKAPIVGRSPAPADAWPDEAPAAAAVPPPPPAASRPVPAARPPVTVSSVPVIKSWQLVI